MVDNLRISDEELEYDDQQLACYEGKPFTGIAVGSGKQGAFEMGYLNGLLSGETRHFHPDGKLRCKCENRDGAKHGEYAEFSASGECITRAQYELGILITRVVRDQQGEMRIDYDINNDSERLQVLKSLRRIQ